jgi:hypothetical protein
VLIRPTPGTAGWTTRFRGESQTLPHLVARQSSLRFQPAPRPLQNRAKRGIDAEKHALRIILVSGHDRRDDASMVGKQQRLRAARLQVRSEGRNLGYFDGFHRSILSLPIHNLLCRLTPTAATVTLGAGSSSIA